MSGLGDKVSNVRAKALKTIKGNKNIYDRVFEKHVDRLRNDTDSEVKELALGMVKA